MTAEGGHMCVPVSFVVNMLEILTGCAVYHTVVDQNTNAMVS